MTIKLIAVYDQPEDAEAFFKHYKEVHTPLVKQTPGLQRLVLNRIVGDAFGGPAPYAAIAEMDYPDRETFDIAMKSSENQAVAKDLMSFAKGKVKVLVAESGEVWGLPAYGIKRNPEVQSQLTEAQPQLTKRDAL
jgi:uncharacterized protein (TIGR02118 family)